MRKAHKCPWVSRSYWLLICSPFSWSPASSHLCVCVVTAGRGEYIKSAKSELRDQCEPGAHRVGWARELLYVANEKHSCWSENIWNLRLNVNKILRIFALSPEVYKTIWILMIVAVKIPECPHVWPLNIWRGVQMHAYRRISSHLCLESTLPFTFETFYGGPTLRQWDCRCSPYPCSLVGSWPISFVRFGARIL